MHLSSSHLFTTIFEFLPVVLAIIAIFRVHSSWEYDRRADKRIAGLAMFSCVSLIITHLAWLNVHITHDADSVSMPDLISNLWTIQNASAMLLIIVISSWKR